MKRLFVLCVPLLIFTGCASDSSNPPSHPKVARTTNVRSQLANDPSVAAEGTAVGTSYPGTNQGTTSTEATSSDTPPR
jgi:hypothetical protein